MAKTYAELSREIEALKVQAEAIRQKEKAGVVERILEAISVYGLTANDLGLGRTASAATVLNASDSMPKRKTLAVDKAPTTKQVPSVKYRDGAGNSWGGRGPKPNWLKAAMASGRSLESFASDRSAGAAGQAATEGVASPKAKPGAKKSPQANKTFKSVVKYRDNDGHTWSGRGPKPAWFTAAIQSGKTPEQLAV